MNQEKSPLVFFTIVARNYISYARTLCRSIMSSHPDAKVYIGLSDKTDAKIDTASEEFELIEASDLQLPNEQQFAFRYDVMEFSTAIKPYVFRWIFQNTKADKVIYLDPDILVVSPLKEVLALLDGGASAVLTPHLTDRIDDGFLPNENNMLRVGVYNLGFIGLARHPEAKKLVDWWCDRLEKGAVVDLEKGLFTDQKWADLMPCLFGDVRVLRDVGYNSAYWNLMHRKIHKKNGQWLSNDRPLAFFHFSGVDPKSPKIFSKHQDRFMLADIGELKELYEYYLEQLKNNGYFETKGEAYAFNSLNDKAPIHKAIRVYFRQLLDGERGVKKPFELEREYFNKPEDGLPGNSLVTRLMYGLALDQPEIQKHFDLQTQYGQEAYWSWFVEYGSKLYKVPEIFVPAGFATQNGAAAGSNNQTQLQKIKNGLYLLGYQYYVKHPETARRLVQMLPSRVRMRLRSNTKTALHSAPQHTQRPKKNMSEIIGTVIVRIFRQDIRKHGGQSGIPRSEDGLTVVGYLKGEFGVAENLRAVAGSLEQTGADFDVMEIDAGPAYKAATTRFDDKVKKQSNKAIQLYCVNADQTRHVLSLLGKDNEKGRYKIGYWFWELSKFPKEWEHAIDLMDEIWAPSRFIESTLKSATTKPVIHMPVAVDFRMTGKYSRGYFGLPENEFLFLFSYDFHSFSQRKNPEAAIEAFVRAFPATDTRVGLVIKTVYGEQHPDEYVKLLEKALTDRRIHVINKVLQRDEMYGLIAACDSYVSLHRAEGFGLGLAEAMLLGKPVIGTAYSGNLDFMHPNNSCLVKHTMTAVPRDAYPCWLEQEWAEPDIDHAAECMTRLVNDEVYRNEIAREGQAYIRKEHSFSAVGQKIKKRISAIEKVIGETSG